MKQFNPFQKSTWPEWTADVLALLGLVIYSVQALIFAHTTVPNLDEGGYLLKGLLFVSGKYRPFDPGIWTNKAPLAFLIPGFVQSLFDAGLRTGRYLAVFFGVMAVIGTWVASRRLGGKWLAVGAVFTLALSPTVIKMYSGGVTQSTIACMLAWSLALSLGEKRSSWQLALGGLLAGLMILVRQNMLPVLPLLAVYAFWQNGWKGFWLLLPGAAAVGIVHVIYWPEILQLWTWVPLIKIPTQVYYGSGGTPLWSPEINVIPRVISVFQAFRFHFIALTGSIVALIFWPTLSHWKPRSDFRISVFLFLLFWGLTYMHSVAAITNDYCVFCFTPYVAFFNIAGILLLVVSVKSWDQQPSLIRQLAPVLLFLVIFTGMSFSASEDIGSSLLHLPAPRFRDMRILPGFVTWQDILENRFHLRINEARKYASTAFGVISTVIITLIIYVAWRWIKRRNGGIGFGSFYASTILVLGIALSPILNGSAGQRDCDSDVIKANEQIGAHLTEIIPDGSLVYWDGGYSAVPLLYLPDIEMFPAQINGAYSFLQGGDSAQLHKFGLWNEEMDAEWKATADFFIIEESRYAGWKEFFNPSEFREFVPTAIGTSCVDETRLRIFQRQ